MRRSLGVLLLVAASFGSAAADQPRKAKAKTKVKAAVTPPRELGELSIEFVEGDRRVIIQSSGLGAVNPSGAGRAEPWFLLEPREIADLLDQFRKADFESMPPFIGMRYVQAFSPHDYVGPPPKNPTPSTSTPPIYTLTLTRDPEKHLHHSVTQSAEGERSVKLAALVDVVRATVARAAKHPLATKDLLEEVKLIKGGKLPQTTIRLFATRSQYKQGEITAGWSMVLVGRRARITLHGSKTEVEGDLTEAEWNAVIDRLAAGPLPPMGYIRARESRAALAINLMHTMSIESASSPSIVIDAANQQMFDAVMGQLEAVKKRIAP